MEEMFTGQALIVNIAFIVLGFFFHAYITKTNAIAASKQSKSILDKAQKEADIVRREAKVQAKDAVLRARENSEKESSSQRKDILDLEKRVVGREKNLSSKLEMLSSKDLQLAGRLTEVQDQKDVLKEKGKELEGLIQEETNRIEKAANLSKDDARKTIMTRMEDELKAEAGGLIRHVQKEAKQEAEKKARELIAIAVQRYAAETVCDLTTSTVSLVSDDIKGRIIGREGRNIKSFEAETGVNVLIDETPEVVVLSSFDPIRREVARIALEELIEDGRIHPVRIEETVAKVRKELDTSIRRAGEEALFGLGITGVAPKLVQILGKLKFRTSYKQNVLDHSVEAAHLLAIMAAELGLDVKLAKRIGIFHDIGKAVDHEVEGGHATIGANLLRKHGEDSVVYTAIGAQHEDMDRSNVYAVLCDAADAMTAARPGARMETTDLYIQRLEKIEKICNQYAGVKSSYAVQAGREVRIMVEPETFTDHATQLLARNIAKQIGKEVKVPGVVRVTVIREMRCVEYAK
ncbi:MAG: ribonuclease Y [Verrucomicrobia bacterium]|nr:ribonuclease Y [Verrucomicrobiota bacterium]